MKALSESSPVTLGFAAVICSAVITAAWFVWGIKVELVALRSDFDRMQADSYTTARAAEDAAREALANPGHKVPDPRHPGEYLVVEVKR